MGHGQSRTANPEDFLSPSDMITISYSIRMFLISTIHYGFSDLNSVGQRSNTSFNTQTNQKLRNYCHNTFNSY